MNRFTETILRPLSCFLVFSFMVKSFGGEAKSWVKNILSGRRAGENFDHHKISKSDLRIGKFPSFFEPSKKILQRLLNGTIEGTVKFSSGLLHVKFHRIFFSENIERILSVFRFVVPFSSVRICSNQNVRGENTKWVNIDLLEKEEDIKHDHPKKYREHFEGIVQ